MRRQEKMQKCLQFFFELSKELETSYEIVKSCNNDATMYLIPRGTEKDISYYGKPSKSFRLSDHWNWYANIVKCAKKNYIQCWSVDIPFARKRNTDTGPSKPRYAIQVAVIGNDGKYHAVYGEIFDRKNKQWTWLERTPKEVVLNL